MKKIKGGLGYRFTDIEKENLFNELRHIEKGKAIALIEDLEKICASQMILYPTKPLYMEGIKNRLQRTLKDLDDLRSDSKYFDFILSQKTFMDFAIGGIKQDVSDRECFDGIVNEASTNIELILSLFADCEKERKRPKNQQNLFSETVKHCFEFHTGQKIKKYAASDKATSFNAILVILLNAIGKKISDPTRHLPR